MRGIHENDNGGEGTASEGTQTRGLGLTAWGDRLQQDWIHSGREYRLIY